MSESVRRGWMREDGSVVTEGRLGLYQFGPMPALGPEAFDPVENAKAALRVTSGYRREASEPRPDCECCHGEGRVLDRTFAHGPRWEPCPACRWELAGQPLRITAPNGRSAVATVTEVTLPPPTHPPISISVREARGLWSRPPVIFDELQRWRSPWWARAIAWGIAIYYAVRR